MSDTRKQDGHATCWDPSSRGELHRVLFEEATDGIFISDPQGRYSAVNPRGAELTGYSCEELIGMAVTDLIPPEDLVRDPIRMDELRQGRIVTRERRIRRKDGSLLAVEISARLLPAGNFLGIVRDITDRKRAEEALRQSEQRFRILFEQAAVGVAQVNSDTGQFVQINQKYCDIVGYSQDEMERLDFQTMTHPEDLATDLANMERLKAGTIREFTMEKRYLRKDGSLVWVNLTVSPMWAPGEPPRFHVAVVEDISERKRAEDLMAIRLRLQEFAAAHSLNELLQKTLDEVEWLTGSSVGFYHFMEADQRTLSLQAWSTRTEKEFCKAQGQGRHYRVDEAGVWVDCVRQRQPVIHNDYATLPHKKGLPEGHAPLIRELVVPIVRKGDIVAILGVGNKTTDYTHKDVDTVAHLADVAWEIAERKRAEEALRESEQRYRNFIANASEGIYRIDFAEPIPIDLPLEEIAERIGRGAVVGEVNEALARMYGLRASDMVGRPATDYAPSYGQRGALLLQRDNYQVVEEETVDRGADGQPLYLTENYTGVVADGRLVRIWGVQRDITERKRAEAALSASEITYREIFNNVSDTIWIHDIETFKFLDVNRNVMEMFGYSVMEAMGLTVDDISSGVHPFTQKTAVELLKKAAGGEPQIFEWHCKHRDGHLFWSEVTLKRGTISGRDCILALERDITERKRVEEEKERLQAQLLQAQKMESVGRLAGGVAHDFNNMLTAILGHAELAMMRCTPSEPTHANLIEIQRAAQRSTDLTRQLLAFARKQTISPKVLDLNDTVAAMLKMLQRLIGEDIDLVWMPGATLWATRIDPSQIDQLLVNLCVNARDAIAGVGKITIETENSTFDEAYCAVHSGLDCGEYVMLAVSDDGCGMSQDTLDHIFEPFFTTKELGRGTGLGLATVYGIVKQNEGLISVYSEPGKGTTFKIYLPRFVGETLEPTAELKSQTPRGRGETVLLVEDEETILNIGRAMLEKLGYTVLTADTPGEALRLAKTHAAEIRLLITDVVMPEMNGRALADAIRNVKPELKCLFTSGYTANVIAHRGVLDEGVDFLQKPFSLQDLAAKVRQALE